MAPIGNFTPKLTVAIPTYNRPAQLEKTLGLLLPQLNNQCFLRILDNNSEIPVKEYAEKIINEYNVQYEIVANRINIGADSNIIRCFEYCETEWLWLLSDDDEVVTNAIEILFRDITIYPDAVNINYYSPGIFHPVRTETKIANGRLEFLRNIDFWGASIFLSVNLYNTNKLKNYWLVNHNTYSHCTQWLIVYYSVNENEQTIQSDHILCYNPLTVSEHKYSSVNLSVARGFSTLLDLITSKTEKKILVSKLKSAVQEWITFESIIKCLLVEYFRSDRQIDIKFLVRRYFDLFYKYFGYKCILKFYLYYAFIFISPDISFQIIRKIILNKKGIDIDKFIS